MRGSGHPASYQEAHVCQRWLRPSMRQGCLTRKGFFWRRKSRLHRTQIIWECVLRASLRLKSLLCQLSGCLSGATHVSSETTNNDNLTTYTPNLLAEAHIITRYRFSGDHGTLKGYVWGQLFPSPIHVSIHCSCLAKLSRLTCASVL